MQRIVLMCEHDKKQIESNEITKRIYAPKARKEVEIIIDKVWELL